MSLSLDGWLEGISASMVIISGCLIGSFCVYISRKTKVRLLLFMGLLIISVCFAWLGEFIDFLTILTTNNNMDNTYGQHGIINFILAPVYATCGVYITIDLVKPKRKWYILPVYFVLAIIYYFILISNPLQHFNYIYPDTPGEELIDNPLAFDSPLSPFILVFLFGTTFFTGFGMLFKGLQSKGIIRRKFLLISYGTFIATVAGMCDGYIPKLGPFLFVTRISIVAGCLILYLALREEREKVKTPEIRKEVKIESDLFRISKFKRQDITEEEVSVSKEKKICLVCKSKLERTIYICPSCDVLYCVRCAATLTGLENACWSCNEPIDPSKPVNISEQERESVEVKPGIAVDSGIDESKHKLK
ncbi:MAG: hypothetical protein ACFFCS_22715 [Candidatus Hodarchaeota archaeon]